MRKFSFLLLATVMCFTLLSCAPNPNPQDTPKIDPTLPQIEEITGGVTRGITRETLIKERGTPTEDAEDIYYAQDKAFGESCSRTYIIATTDVVSGITTVFDLSSMSSSKEYVQFYEKIRQAMLSAYGEPTTAWDGAAFLEAEDPDLSGQSWVCAWQFSTERAATLQLNYVDENVVIQIIYG